MEKLRDRQLPIVLLLLGIFPISNLGLSRSSLYSSRLANEYQSQVKTMSSARTHKKLQGLRYRIRGIPSHTLTGPHVCGLSCCRGWKRERTSMCITPVCVPSCENDSRCIRPSTCLHPLSPMEANDADRKYKAYAAIERKRDLRQTLENVHPGEVSRIFTICENLCIHGVCHSGHQPTCRCHSGYYGANCQRPVREVHLRSRRMTRNKVISGLRYTDNRLRLPDIRSSVTALRTRTSTTLMLGKCFKSFRGKLCGLSFNQVLTMETCCSEGLGDGWGPSCTPCSRNLLGVTGRTTKNVRYSARCPRGFLNVNRVCRDINECQKKSTTCDNGSCVNSRGSYWCRCNPGYHQHVSRKKCLIDRASKILIPIQHGDVCYLFANSQGNCDRSKPIAYGMKTACCCTIGFAWGHFCEICPKSGTDEYDELCQEGRIITTSQLRQPVTFLNNEDEVLTATSKYLPVMTQGLPRKTVDILTSTDTPFQNIATAVTVIDEVEHFTDKTVGVKTTTRLHPSDSISPAFSASVTTPCESSNPEEYDDSNYSSDEFVDEKSSNFKKGLADTKQPSSTTNDGTGPSPIAVKTTVDLSGSHVPNRKFSSTSSASLRMSRLAIPSSVIPDARSLNRGASEFSITAESPAKHNLVTSTSTELPLYRRLSEVPVTLEITEQPSAFLNQDTLNMSDMTERNTQMSWSPVETELPKNVNTIARFSNVSNFDVKSISPEMVSGKEFSDKDIAPESYDEYGEVEVIKNSFSDFTNPEEIYGFPRTDFISETKAEAETALAVDRGSIGRTTAPYLENRGQAAKFDLFNQPTSGHVGVTKATSTLPTLQSSDIDECIQEVCGEGGTCANIAGSYICDCFEGYQLAQDRNVCKDIDECIEEVCGKGGTCANIAGSYICDCYEGYHLAQNENICKDIDECLDEKCGEGGTCANIAGSYTCYCLEGYQLVQDENYCKDIDECEVIDCGASAICRNTPGSYECGCSGNNESYEDTSKACITTSEDERKPKIRKPCYSTSYFCRNVLSQNLTQEECCCTIGRSWGDCKSNRVCQMENELIGAMESICPHGRGFESAEDGKVVDIDECELFGSDIICHNGLCVNSFGGYRCECYRGFYYDRRIQACADVNECRLRTKCIGGFCINLRGSYKCHCPAGTVFQSRRFTNRCIGSRNRSRPIRINLLGRQSRRPRRNLKQETKNSMAKGRCFSGAKCLAPLWGEYSYQECCCGSGVSWGSPCTICPLPLTEDFRFLCQYKLVAKPEAQLRQDRAPNKFGIVYRRHCVCENGKCSLSEDGYACKCEKGFRFNKNLMTCTDINECKALEGVCRGGVCFNEIGSFRCKCLRGYQLSTDAKSCLEENSER